jgi:uncharacterized membrane protein
MYSRIKLFGHPIHPMLVGFPVTFYVAALVCFAASAFGADARWFQIGVYANLAGVITAVLAAIPGFLDWALGVPTGSPAKATGLAHMVLNVAALLVFALNLLLEWRHRFDPDPSVGWSVILPAVGVAITLVAGFLGWQMVQKHHVGIDLTPEQERLEPRASPRVARHGPSTAEHGHGVR